MAANIFDDKDGIFHVLMNDEEQHSLWPASIEVPLGWRVVHEKRSREECLAYVEDHWTDMRPLGLRKLMDEPAG